MLDSFCPIPKCPTTHLSYHRFYAAPRALLAKTESNQSQEREATLLEVLRSCLMSRYRWEGWCCFKTSTFEPRRIICQPGSALDNVDGCGLRTNF